MDKYKSLVRDLLRDELIGLEIEVKESPNRYEEGIKGSVVDETKNTLKIRSEGDIKTIQKSGRMFVVVYKNHKVMIKGDLFSGRPEERIKKNVRKIVR